MLSISKLHKSIISISVFLPIVSFLCTACEKEVLRYQEMQAYYDESCQLSVATADSVASFTDKVKTFVAQYPAAQEDPLYSKIRENVQQCWLNLTIVVNTEWDGVTLKSATNNLSSRDSHYGVLYGLTN